MIINRTHTSNIFLQRTTALHFQRKGDCETETCCRLVAIYAVYHPANFPVQELTPHFVKYFPPHKTDCQQIWDFLLFEILQIFTFHQYANELGKEEETICFVWFQSDAALGNLSVILREQNIFMKSNMF